MKKQSLLKKKYLQRMSEDILKLSKEEMLEILQISDELYSDKFISKLAVALYRGVYAKWSESTTEKTEKFVAEVEILKGCSVKEEKELIFKEIVEKAKKECFVKEYDFYKLPEALESVIRYGLEIEDVHSCVMLMKKRKEVLDCKRGYDTSKIPDFYDDLDARQIYKKFIRMIVDQCSDETATKYIQELADGKYFKLWHATERGGWHVFEDDIKDTYKLYKLTKPKSSEL